MPVQGEAQAIFAKAEAQAKAVDKLADAMMRDGAQDAVVCTSRQNQAAAILNLMAVYSLYELPSNMYLHSLTWPNAATPSCYLQIPVMSRQWLRR
jgi:hypothetical protein